MMLIKLYWLKMFYSWYPRCNAGDTKLHDRHFLSGRISEARQQRLQHRPYNTLCLRDLLPLGSVQRITVVRNTRCTEQQGNFVFGKRRNNISEFLSSLSRGLDTPFMTGNRIDKYTFKCMRLKSMLDSWLKAEYTNILKTGIIRMLGSKLRTEHTDIFGCLSSDQSQFNGYILGYDVSIFRRKLS